MKTDKGYSHLDVVNALTSLKSHIEYPAYEINKRETKEVLEWYATNLDNPNVFDEKSKNNLNRLTFETFIELFLDEE